MQNNFHYARRLCRFLKKIVDAKYLSIMMYLVLTDSIMDHNKKHVWSPCLMIFLLFHLLTVDGKGEAVFKSSLFLIKFLLSYLRHIITKFFFEDLHLSSFFCQRTASPLTDWSSITDLITSHSIFAVGFFLCLPTSVKKKVVQNPKEQFCKYVLIRSTQKNTCWTDDRGESVSSLGTLWHRWILPPLQLNSALRFFLQGKNLMTRAFWQKNCYCSNKWWAGR